MNWNLPLEVQCVNTSYPYSAPGSFIEYVEGLTYDHVNFIFAGASHAQESMYPTTSTNFYKLGTSEPPNASYYDYFNSYAANGHVPRVGEYSRSPDNSSNASSEPTGAVNTQWEESADTSTYVDPVECPRSHQSGHDYQAVWQDNIDPDNMTYEELLELGETVGTQSRGLPQELISLLPVSKYKPGFFLRKKSRNERCVICQMEYRRGDRRITLPCKHAYHASCGTRWLSINKACPICYTEVFSAQLNKK